MASKQLTLFAEASPVRTSALPEKGQGSPESAAAFGLSFTGSFKNSGRASSSLKTSRPFVVEDWTRYSGHSLRSGMMQSGIVFPLPPLAPLTAATGSGLWPTPTVSHVRGLSPEAAERDLAKGHQMTLRHAVVLWPTPHANCHTGPGHQGRQGGFNLQTAVHQWPTRATRDWKDSGYEPAAQGRKSPCLPASVVLSEGLKSRGSGTLNPTWVEWLMGFPAGWTDLKPSEMPSSPRSRK
jgi:hypothetical protein